VAERLTGGCSIAAEGQYIAMKLGRVVKERIVVESSSLDVVKTYSV
jgi:hypothetical protein